ncbi:MAG: ribbon-helix-helix protein, CopG family [Candidatus Dormibacteria bacterium]
MTRKIVVYLPDELVEDLNLTTAASDKSRSELVGAAVRRYLTELRRRQLHVKLTDEAAFRARLAQLVQTGQIAVEEEPEPALGARGKHWIN